MDMRRIVNGADGLRRRRAAYALPTIFTAGNIFLGFLAIMESFQGVLQAMSGNTGPNAHFELAALYIGIAAVLDGLDGRIARMTNTTSDFGRELDSLADVITFGLAPAVMAFTWGVMPALNTNDPFVRDHPFIGEHLRRLGYFIPFLFLLCGAARLARFNIQKNPVPKNPGRPDRKYFVGLPIPAAAALPAAIVYIMDGAPILQWQFSMGWLILLAILSFLMVSTWRYQSFKDLQLLRPRSPFKTILVLIAVGLIVGLLGVDAALLALSSTYVLSGIAVRIGGLLRRRFRHHPQEPEHQLG